jgi:hypothetical protein
MEKRFIGCYMMMNRAIAVCWLSLVSLISGQGASFDPWSFTEKDLFPSAIISTATVDWNGEEQTAEDKKGPDDPRWQKDEVPIYGDENGWLAVALYDLPARAEVRVEISADGYLKPSVWEGMVKKAHTEEVRIFPRGVWDYEALHKVREQRPVNVTFKVWVNGEALPEQTEVCTMKSINDCPFYVLMDEEGEDIEDFSMVFAAYVNENHPWVDGILKEALQTGVIDSFTGYQSGEASTVLAQVFAVWNVLQKRGIKYSDISTTTPSKYVVSQTVRFLDDSIDATQANCVDGTVLMAAILRKIGINVYLTMVPGHCLLAFDLGKGEEDEILGLETTMLGTTDLGGAGKEIEVPAEIKGTEHEKSFKTLAAAIGAGTATLEEHAEVMANGEDPGTQLISVAAARELGIMPIASGRERK